jgi:type II secretory pathway pseudopilin PulG
MRPDGYCLIEVVAALGVAATVSVAAVPQILASVDDSRARGAARYLSTRLQQARMEAVTRSRHVAVRFTAAGSSYSYAVYQDGNGNGVLTRDIQHGVDTEVHAAERLSDQFAGVDFGALPGLPAADAGGTAPGADPIRVGAANMVSFTSAGTSSTGTLYILGKRNAEYALVIFGETGKVRLLKWNAVTGQWGPL